MNLDAFRDAVLSEARDDAERWVDGAEREAEERIADARDRASESVEGAREAGRHAAAREMHRRQTEVRRRARERVLRARRDVMEQLRAHVRDLLRDRTSTDEYERFEEHLRSMAAEQLGAGADVEQAERGGFVARLDRRVVDYRLDVIVDRAFDEMADELGELWR